jgi:hypothetical protein
MSTVSIPALPPLATTFSSALPRFFGLQTLSISLNHFPPSIPVSRVANMRSVQTSVSTHVHRARVSPSCGVEMCRSSSVDMLTLRVPTDKVALVQALEALEFRCMDCLVYYDFPTEDLPAVKRSTLEIREAPAGAPIPVKSPRCCKPARL